MKHPEIERNHNMKDIDYPSLFQASDKAAIAAQTHYLNSLKLYILLLIIAATLSLIGINSRASAIGAAITFLGTIGLNSYIFTKHLQKNWYITRAVAESVKTITWRFIVRAEPFFGNTSLNEARKNFATSLHKILEQNKQIAGTFDSDLINKSQITEKMLEVRNMSFNDRKAYYLEHRIQEQRDWYSRKTRYNANRHLTWFIILICIQVVAIMCVLLRIAYPNFQYWPPEVLAVVIAGILSWLQIKRHQELAAAYSLAAQEIGIIQANIESVYGEENMSNFVQDAENAFSREHTQWVARKDHL